MLNFSLSDASSINCTTTAEVTRTLPVKAPTPPPPPLEENKENLTLNLFGDDVDSELREITSPQDNYGEFSFERSLTEPTNKESSNSINTRGMFTAKIPTPEVPKEPTRELTMDLLPPITPQSTKKKRRSLLGELTSQKYLPSIFQKPCR